jgi:hypothetical protein
MARGSKLFLDEKKIRKLCYRTAVANYIYTYCTVVNFNEN